ncbi:MAG: RNA polymerase sigma-70 factor [Bacteroidaceae bacterium]|nr:RNA polymerase sigma-70 factor [Bacteroidaceae bacterium]
MFNTRFSELYLNNYSRMLRIAKVYIPEHEEAENIVHDVFVSVWEHRDHVLSMDNVEGYMAVSLKNRCLDYLKHLLHVAEYADHVTESQRHELTNKINSLNCYDAASSYDNEVINGAVRNAIEGLPPRCRQVFLYSRRDHLKNAEIAERMGISENTVEAQMTIAFRKLHAALSQYLPLTIKRMKKTAAPKKEACTVFPVERA